MRFQFKLAQIISATNCSSAEIYDLILNLRNYCTGKAEADYLEQDFDSICGRLNKGDDGFKVEDYYAALDELDFCIEKKLKLILEKSIIENDTLSIDFQKSDKFDYNKISKIPFYNKSISFCCLENKTFFSIFFSDNVKLSGRIADKPHLNFANEVKAIKNDDLPNQLLDVNKEYDKRTIINQYNLCFPIKADISSRRSKLVEILEKNKSSVNSLLLQFSKPILEDELLESEETLSQVSSNSESDREDVINEINNIQVTELKSSGYEEDLEKLKQCMPAVNKQTLLQLQRLYSFFIRDYYTNYNTEFNVSSFVDEYIQLSQDVQNELAQVDSDDKFALAQKSVDSFFIKRGEILRGLKALDGVETKIAITNTMKSDLVARHYNEILEVQADIENIMPWFSINLQQILKVKDLNYEFEDKKKSIQIFFEKLDAKKRPLEDIINKHFSVRASWLKDLHNQISTFSESGKVKYIEAQISRLVSSAKNKTYFLHPGLSIDSFKGKLLKDFLDYDQSLVTTLEEASKLNADLPLVFRVYEGLLCGVAILLSVLTVLPLFYNLYFYGNAIEPLLPTSYRVSKLLDSKITLFKLDMEGGYKESFAPSGLAIF